VYTDFNTDTFCDSVFRSKLTNPDDLAVYLYHHQLKHNIVLKEYHQLTGGSNHVNSIEEIRFLPISFFKTHQVICGNKQAEKIFTSSGTSGMTPSSHHVLDLNIYRKSFQTAFNIFYGAPGDYIICALLPGYLERTGSSLVMMADELIQQSSHPDSGFFLNDFQKLAETLKRCKSSGRKTILLGVTYALLDFAEQYGFEFPELIVMETGGMKGRKEELTRNEIHQILKTSFHTTSIHSEYGMTELLSQAYSKENGIFNCPPWMKILISDPTDPFTFLPNGKRGVINVIDLANINSCAFIRTEDSGICHADGSFEVTGRLDQSDVRGCSLMYP